MKALFALLLILLAGCANGATAPADGPAAGSTILRLGEEARLGALRVRALTVEEDSRCPTTVQCIQAGTVRLAVSLREGLASRRAVLRLDEPLRVDRGRFLLLRAVCPHPREPGPIPAGAYRFHIALGNGSAPPPLDFACPRTP